MAGSDLAISLLDEGSSRHQPKFESLLARIAIRALDTANPNLQLRLADAYEPQLQGIYQNELTPRLTSTSPVHFLGAWNCLFRLVAADVPWAIELAMRNWPQQQDRQVHILQSVPDIAKNSWAMDKLLELIPVTSPSTFRDVFRWDSYRRDLEEDSGRPELGAAMSIIQSEFRNFDTISVANTGISYGPICRLHAKNAVKAPRFRDTEGWHPNWNIYKHAAQFLETLSKDRLAEVLSSLAGFFYKQEDTFPILEREHLPWPILACLSSCTNSQELLEMAERAKRGELGDAEDWKKAETRWFDNGITHEDLISMSNDRLPFDSDMKSYGFPTVIPTLGPIFLSAREPDHLAEMLNTYNNLGAGHTRSFVASTINWLLICRSFDSRQNMTSDLPQINFQTLMSIYRDVPPRSLVPIHMTVNLIGDSIQRIPELLELFRTKKFVIDTGGHGNLMERSVRLMRMAYVGLDEDALLLPILGKVAENGHLSHHQIEIKHGRNMDTAVERLAVFLITLCQERWQTDSNERLIEDAQNIGESSSINVFNRIVNALENTRPSGANVEKFVVGLTKLIPGDEFHAHRRYVSLLEDTLRRRTSHFADLNETSRFALPEGIVQLLEK